MRRRGKDWRKRGGSKGKKGLDEKWRNWEEKKRRGADDKGTERGWGGENARDGGRGRVVMSHHQDLSPGGPVCCGGGSVTHMQKHTHTHRGIPAVMPLMSPPAVEAGGRQYRVTTGTHSSHTLSSSPSLSDTHTHNDDGWAKGLIKTLRLDVWMYVWMVIYKGRGMDRCRKEKRTHQYTRHAFLHLSHILSIVIHISLGGAYAEADVVKREHSVRMTCRSFQGMMIRAEYMLSSSYWGAHTHTDRKLHGLPSNLIRFCVSDMFNAVFGRTLNHVTAWVCVKQAE